MARVFLSYSREDQARIVPLAAALEQAGHEVWWDRRLTGGAEFEQAIEQALAAAQVVVVAWSATAAKSHWVRDEAAAGRDSDRLVPVTLDGTLPPLGFRQFHSIDLSGWDGSDSQGCHELEQAVAAKAGEERPTGEPGPTPPDAKRKRLLPIWAWGAIAGLVIIAALGTWWLARPAASAPTLALGRFEAIGAGVEPGLAAGIEQELRTAFGDLRVPLATGEATLSLTGTARRAGDKLRLVLRLDDVAGAATLWTGTREVAAGDGPALSEQTRQIAAIVECGLAGARRGPQRLRSEALALYLRYCEADITSGSVGRQLDAARAITAAAPEFVGGWLALAASANLYVISNPSSENPALSAEAMAAARRAIALAPDEADGYVWLAVLMPPEQAAEREATLRRAAGLRSFRCACAYQFLGDFLLQSGRMEEALASYRRALDQEPESPSLLALWRLVIGYQYSGRRELAAETMTRLESLHRGDPVLPQLRRDVAAWAGRWAEVAELVRFSRSEEQAAMRNAYLALDSRDAGRIAEAGAVLERLPVRHQTETLIVPALALLGRNDAAFAALERSLSRKGYYAAPGRFPGITQPLLWDPALRPLWNDARFPAFLQRAGFIAYWRQSRSRPDVCRTNEAPAFCRLLG